MSRLITYKYLMKSWEEYKKEPLYEQFGDYLTISESLITDEIRRAAMEILCDQLFDTARITGREPTKFYRWLEMPTTQQSGICAFKMWLKLSGTPDAYAHRIHLLTSDWISSLGSEIEILQTWRGFLRFKWGQFKKRIP